MKKLFFVKFLRSNRFLFQTPIIHKNFFLYRRRFINYYKVLGIPQTAGRITIKKTFYKLAKKYHPDNKITGSKEKFQEIN